MLKIFDIQQLPDAIKEHKILVIIHINLIQSRRFQQLKSFKTIIARKLSLSFIFIRNIQDQPLTRMIFFFITFKKTIINLNNQ